MSSLVRKTEPSLVTYTHLKLTVIQWTEQSSRLLIMLEVGQSEEISAVRHPIPV